MRKEWGTGFIKYVRRNAALYPEKTAMIHNDDRITWHDLMAEVNQISNALLGVGISAGSRVAIISKNCIEYLKIEFALYQLGAVAVKINWRMTAKEITYILCENHVEMAFQCSELLAERRELISMNPGICFREFNINGSGESDFCKWYQKESVCFECRPIHHTMPAMIVHTSGTTGIPKFVCFTHGDLIKKLTISLEIMPFEPDTVFLLIEQLFHIACMRAYMCTAIGCTLVLISHFDSNKYLEIVEKEHVTSSGMIPSVLNQILENPCLGAYNLQSLKTMNYSTCMMPLPLIQRAKERLHCDFYQVYGMTEMLGLVTILNPKEHFTGHISSVGKMTGGYAACIMTEDLRLCGFKTVGEIFIRGPVMLREYLNNPELTKAVLKDGWYATGDLGYMDADGYLHICGRKDDLIISGGENIYPQEIINVLKQLSDISEVAVYGVKDSHWGEKVWASIVLQPGSKLNEGQIRTYCRKNLAHYKIPKGFDFREELPKNTTGKVLIRQLMKELEVKQKKK